MPYFIGLISDTHGVLKPKVHEVFQGVDLILHAGDHGGEAILLELQTIAPVTAVMGNTDFPGRPPLPDSVDREFDGVRLHLSHGHELGRPTPARMAEAYPNADVVVYGHTHVPGIDRFGDRWVINTGPAGDSRRKGAPLVGLLRIDGGHVVSAELVSLE